MGPSSSLFYTVYKVANGAYNNTRLGARANRYSRSLILMDLLLHINPYIRHNRNSLIHIIGWIACPRLRLVQSNFQPNRQAKPNQVQNNKKERENGRGEGRGTHNMPQNIAALQSLSRILYLLNVRYSKIILQFGERKS